MDVEAKRQIAEGYEHWFHSVDLGDGVVTNGKGAYSKLKASADIYFKDLPAGSSVLDIGAWDGFFSVEAKRSGAGRVMACDHFVWTGPAPHRTGEGFDRVMRATGLDIEKKVLPLDDVTVSAVGEFDCVLFNGIWYHIKNPLSVLDNLARIATRRLTIETYLDLRDINRPAMVYFPGEKRPRGGPTNGWGPNAPLIRALLRDHGFPNISFSHTPQHRDRRGIFVAER